MSTTIEITCAACNDAPTNTVPLRDGVALCVRHAQRVIDTARNVGKPQVGNSADVVGYDDHGNRWRLVREGEFFRLRMESVF